MLSEIKLLEALAIAQGFYFFVTGLWAVVHIRSFLAVTGPKTDLWLVKTVGALITVIGAVILISGFRQAVSFEIAIVGAASAAVLALVDVYYVGKGTISKIYLLDSIAEVAIILVWVIAFFQLA